MNTNWETQYDAVVLHAWEQWTQNGLGLDTEDCAQTIKSVQNAATNAWQDGMADDQWIYATIRLLNGKTMPAYYITHTDDADEEHQLYGAWDAPSPEDAIAQMLTESQGMDDGRWTAREVTRKSDVIS
jgi:hypothetical protein